MIRLGYFTSALIVLWLIGSLLIVGSQVLIPFVIAVFIWNLLNTINSIISQIPKVGKRLPRWLSMIFAFTIVGVLLYLLIFIITNNVSSVIEASDRYQENLLKIFSDIEGLSF